MISPKPCLRMMAFLCFFLLANLSVFAQAGSLDASFNATGSGANNHIRTMDVQSNGRILIGGDFTSYNGIQAKYFARLMDNGTLDSDFQTAIGIGPNGPVYQVQVLADGKILVAGNFTYWNGSPSGLMVRLLSNGSKDPTFNYYTSLGTAIMKFAVQPDGKIVVGGQFTYGNTIRGLARLNANGSLDVTFNPGKMSPDPLISCIAIQGDGKILVAGSFSYINDPWNLNSGYFIRLESDGSLDNSFLRPVYFSNPSGAPTQIQELNNGKLLIANGYGIRRLNNNGELDPTFNEGVEGSATSFSMQPDGKIICGGAFINIDCPSPPTPRSGIARLNANGCLDAGFNPGTGVGGIGLPAFAFAKGIQRIIWLPSGKALIAGAFTSYNGIGRNHIARINAPTTASCIPPDLTLNTSLSTLTQSVCAGSPINQIIIRIGGGATGATVTGLPSGIVGSVISGNLFFIRGNSSLEGAYDFTLTSAGGCGAASSISGSITIKPNLSWFKDEDNDGFGDPSTGVVQCEIPTLSGFNWVRNNNDCNDTDPGINPGVSEIPDDGIDNDCDGQTDEGSDPPGTTYCDLDGDGFGDPGCPIPPAGRPVFRKGTWMTITTEEGVANNTDCDDTNPELNPLAFEISNESDDDCDGINDDGTAVQIWYADMDGDAFGNENDSLASAIPVQGYVLVGGDCDDTNPNVNPNAIEICGNGIDDNCNGETDENSISANAGFDQTTDQNSGNLQLIGFPAGGSWTGTGVNGSGLFNTNQAPGAYTLTYSITAPCPASDQVVITLLPNNSGTTLEKPNFSPQAGTYSGPQMVTLSSSDPEATIYYTLTGNTPLLSPWPNSFTKIYSGPIQVIKNTQIRAIAVRDGFTNSSVAVSNYTILEGLVVENPVITPGTGTYSGAQSISISTQTAGASIYYTTNGNNPLLTTPNSFTKLYEGPFIVNQTTNVKAIAVKTSLQNSGVSSVFLIITDPPICAAPNISPGSGTYTGAQTVSLSTTTAGATILYTTNGNIPVEGTSFTKVYSQPFVVNSTTTIRAIAIKVGFEKSSCPRAELVITSPTQTVSTPLISPGTGIYVGPQIVSITCSTPGATIFYTTNGNVPRLDVPNSFTKIYTGPFTISSSTTIRAIATAPGMLPSNGTVAYLTLGGGARKSVAGVPLTKGAESDFLLIPNPNSGHFKLVEKSGKMKGDRIIDIYSATGQVVYSRSWTGNRDEFEVELDGLPSGIYTVRIIGESDQKLIRFQKQ